MADTIPVGVPLLEDSTALRVPDNDSPVVGAGHGTLAMRRDSKTRHGRFVADNVCGVWFG